ncbi:MAG: hypothetical protein HQK68_04760 [Desulfamplus sp.]|nr:hypothetical protein [Desulfamplus sp.]
MFDKNKFDSESGYCRMLGHEVSFSYCKVAKSGSPCFKIMDCWFERIPIEDYITKNYSKEQIDKFLEKPPSKITTLYDLIEQAKQRAKEKNQQGV